MSGANTFKLAREAYAQGNPQKALALFERASAQGELRALRWMARLYARGEGVQQSCRMVELLLQRVAASHDPVGA
jgi:TPR repeat protein